MKKLIPFFLLLIVCQTLSAQRRGAVSCGAGQVCDNTIIKYKLEYIRGFIIDHSEKVSPLIQDPVNGLEFAVEFPKYGGQPWHHYYAYPTVGLGLSYLDLGNPDYLGAAINFYPYINIPIFQTQIFSFNFKVGGGLSYVTKIYDEDKPYFPDENNLAIGSHLNAYLNGGVNTEIRFSKSPSSFISRFSFTADAGINHISNGSVQKPNAGLNMFNVGVGLKYNPYLWAVPMRSGLSRMERKWSLEPVLGVGVNQQNVTDTKRYLNMSLSVGGYRPLTNAYRFGLNADLFYNDAFFKDREFPDYYAGESGKFRAGFSLANELMFGRFTTGVHVGVYAFNQIDHDGQVYFRLRAKYRVYDEFFINVSVKTHMQVAECAEIGIGYSLSKKEKAPYSWIPEKKKPEKKDKKEKAPKTPKFKKQKK